VIDNSGLASQVGRQKPAKQPGEGTQLVRLREDRLQRGLGRKNPAELGRAHHSQGGK